jgi:UDP-2,3-diacylglucosamine hydrolase
MLRKRNRVIILGDWISLFSYAVFDGETLELHQYDEA